jgi:multisubunit Na+/H+ antiporter MnhF subunit
VSLHALAAVVYRTFQGELTPNRLTVIGWNGINIGILVSLIVTQLRAGREGWVEAILGLTRLLGRRCGRPASVGDFCVGCDGRRQGPGWRRGRERLKSQLREGD